MPCGPQNLPGSWLRSLPNRPITLPSRSTMLTRSSSSATYITSSRVDVQLGRPLEAGPHVEVLAVGREDLDAVVLAVGDVDLALVLPDAVHGVEEARACPSCRAGRARCPARPRTSAACRLPRTCGRGCCDSRPRRRSRRRATTLTSVGWWNGRAGVADAVEHRHAAAGGVRTGRLAHVLRVAGVGVLVARAERQAMSARSCRTSARPAGRGRRSTAVSSGVMHMPWASSKMPSPQASSILPDLSKTDVRVLGAREDVDVVLRVDRDRADLAPLPARGQLAPALDQLVLAIAGFDNDLVSADGHVRATSARSFPRVLPPCHPERSEGSVAAHEMRILSVLPPSG